MGRGKIPKSFPVTDRSIPKIWGAEMPPEAQAGDFYLARLFNSPTSVTYLTKDRLVPPPSILPFPSSISLSSHPPFTACYSEPSLLLLPSETSFSPHPSITLHLYFLHWCFAPSTSLPCNMPPLSCSFSLPLLLSPSLPPLLLQQVAAGHTEVLPVSCTTLPCLLPVFRPTWLTTSFSLQ